MAAKGRQQQREGERVIEKELERETDTEKYFKQRETEKE